MVTALLGVSSIGCGVKDAQTFRLNERYGANPKVVSTQPSVPSGSPTEASVMDHRYVESQNPVVGGAPIQSDSLHQTDLQTSSATPISSLGYAPVHESANGSTSVNRIVFIGSDDLIYTIDPSGSGRIQVSPPTADVGSGEFGGLYTWPVWSPSGDKIIFSAVLPDPGQNRVRVSIYRAPASGGDAATVTPIFRDDPSTTGIGPGVPHYASWSPNGEKIAVIAGRSDGLYTVVFDSDTGSEQRHLLEGSPVYHAWSRDSTYLIVHLEDTVTIYDLSERGITKMLDTGIYGNATNYLAPDFSPDDDRYALMTRRSGQNWLSVEGLDGSGSISLVSRKGMSSFKWSPDGNHIALLSSSDDSLIYDHLSLVDPNNGSERMLARGDMIAFWWSPNSQYIVTVDRHPDLAEAMRWTSIDLATGSGRALINLIPSSEFGFLQTYFSQYAQSHELWSPDSTSLVMAGVKLDDETLKSVLADGFVDLVSQIWIVDATDGAAYAVAEGSLAFWSPQ